MSLPVRYNAFAAFAYARKHPTGPPGANVWDGPAQGNPVVLLHGLGAGSAANWFSLAPLLVNSGRRVFALDYGRYGGGPLTDKGTGDVRRCADELASFVERVQRATGSTMVDLVGHSVGALVAQYYLKRMGGHHTVERMVGIAPTFHGTTFNGLLRVPLFRRVGRRLVGENITQQAAGSEFLRELYADGDTAPGVVYTVVSPAWDTFTTPVRAQSLAGPLVTNLRMRGPAEHILIVYNRKALAVVVEALAQ